MEVKAAKVNDLGEKLFVPSRDFFLIIGFRGCNSTSEIRCFSLWSQKLWDFIERMENLFVWKSVGTFHINDWTCSKVFFSVVQCKGSKAVEFSGNLGFFHSVNAFWLKAQQSQRNHCLLQIFNWMKQRACHLNSHAQVFSSVGKLSFKGLCGMIPCT